MRSLQSPHKFALCLGIKCLSGSLSQPSIKKQCAHHGGPAPEVHIASKHKRPSCDQR
jgi:hypothetical protein